MTGAVPLFVGVNGSGPPLFFGHAEKFPRMSIRPRFSQVFCDLSGQSVPLDLIFDGEEAQVIADMTRWNENVYAIMADRAKVNQAGVTPNRGTSGFGEYGTLMMTEGAAFPLYLVFPYTNKPAYASQPAGYRFFASMLYGPDDHDLGSTARKMRMVFHCIRQIQPATGGTTVKGVDNFGGLIQFGLYDGNVSACNGVPVT